MLIAIIKILPNLNKSLDTRDQAQILFERLESYCPNCNDLVIDFSGIDFMSRSFADQFHKEKIRLQEMRHIIVSIENEVPQIHSILNSVSKTQKTMKRESSTFQFHSIFTKDQMAQFFSTL